jgi:hypothetical protein
MYIDEDITIQGKLAIADAIVKGRSLFPSTPEQFKFMCDYTGIMPAEIQEEITKAVSAASRPKPAASGTGAPSAPGKYTGLGGQVDIKYTQKFGSGSVSGNVPPVIVPVDIDKILGQIRKKYQETLPTGVADRIIQLYTSEEVEGYVKYYAEQEKLGMSQRQDIWKGITKAPEARGLASSSLDEQERKFVTILYDKVKVLTTEKGGR